MCVYVCVCVCACVCIYVCVYACVCVDTSFKTEGSGVLVHMQELMETEKEYVGRYGKEEEEEEKGEET